MDLNNCITYKNARQIRHLCKLLQKVSQYKRDFDEPNMSFWKKENDLLEKYLDKSQQ